MEKVIRADIGKFNVQHWLLRFILDRNTRVFRHVGVLILLLFITNDDKQEYVAPADLYIKIGALVWLLSQIYINIYVLVPKLLFKGKHLAYCLGVLAVLLICYGTVLLTEPVIAPYRITPTERQPDTVRSFVAFLFIFSILIAASTALKLFQRWIRDSYRIHELEKLTLQSELNQLKSQINPHFLFNTLNNAHVLTKTDPAKSSQVLIKLSELLRYQLYDCAEEKVLLVADINFLADFLNLEKIRRDSFEFVIEADNNISHNWVPPFIFIPFVENAVKHSMDATDQSYVHLKFSRQQHKLLFECINSVPAIATSKGLPGGIGLANIRRRLELLYPSNHTLTVTQTKERFHVALSIPL